MHQPITHSGLPRPVRPLRLGPQNGRCGLFMGTWTSRHNTSTYHYIADVEPACGEGVPGCEVQAHISLALWLIVRGKSDFCGKWLTMWYPLPWASAKPRPQMCSWHSIFLMTYKNEKPPTLGYSRSHGTVSKTRFYTWQNSSSENGVPTAFKILWYFIDRSVLCPKDWLACGGGHLPVNIFLFPEVVAFQHWI